MINRILLITSLLSVPQAATACQTPPEERTLTDSQKALKAFNKNILFNFTALSQYNRIKQHVIDEHGAQLLHFQNSDNQKLEGLYIKRQNADHTIIAPGGFYPGRMEGMTPTILLFPESNIFLFNARGHGNSEGSFWSTLPAYGVHEYKDIIAAMETARAQSDKPLIILGMCAGGFHTINALNKLAKDNVLEKYNVQAMIADSVFTSGEQVLPAGYYHFREKTIPQLLRTIPLYKNYKTAEIKDTWISKAIWASMGYPLITALTLMVKPGITRNNETTRIDTQEKMSNIKHIPILFMHAENDKYIEPSQVQALKNMHNNPKDEMILFKNSSHANNLIIHKHKYQKAVQNFIAGLNNDQTAE